MRKILCLILLTFALPALAQQANFNYNGIQTTSTVATASTAAPANAFANVVTGQNGRQSCWIQYRPVTATAAAASLGLVFFGPTAPTSTLQAFALTGFQFLNCEQANEVEGNGIWISSTQTNDTFTIKVK